MAQYAVSGAYVTGLKFQRLDARQRTAYASRLKERSELPRQVRLLYVVLVLAVIENCMLFVNNWYESGLPTRETLGNKAIACEQRLARTTVACLPALRHGPGRKI